MMNMKILNFDDRGPATHSKLFKRAGMRVLFLIPMLAGLAAREKGLILGGLLFYCVPYIWHLLDRERQSLVDVWSGIIVLERITEPSGKDVKELLKSDNAPAWLEPPSSHIQEDLIYIEEEESRV